MKLVKNKNSKILLTFFALIGLIALAVVVYADSDSLTAQTTSANADPTVDNCIIATKAVTPTENSTTAVTVRMNVTDTNGVGDLNNSLAKVEADDNVTGFSALYESASNTTCTSSIPAPWTVATRHVCTCDSNRTPRNLLLSCLVGLRSP